MPVTGRRDRVVIAHERLTRTRNGWFCGGLHKLSSAGLLLTEQCDCTAVTQSEPVRNRQIRVYAINL